MYWSSGSVAPSQEIPVEWKAEEETDTSALEILMPNYQGSADESNSKDAKTGSAVKTPDSNVSLSGTGSFAVAAWEKLRGPVTMDQEGEYSSKEASLAASQMMNDTEIVASVYDGSKWTSTRLTNNKKCRYGSSGGS